MLTKKAYGHVHGAVTPQIKRKRMKRMKVKVEMTRNQGMLLDYLNLFISIASIK